MPAVGRPWPSDDDDDDGHEVGVEGEMIWRLGKNGGSRKVGQMLGKLGMFILIFSKLPFLLFAAWLRN